MNRESSVFTAADTDEAKLGRFVAGGSAAVVASMLGGMFAFMWAWLMTRMLGKEDYSILGPYLNAFWILTSITSFGLQHTLTTFISHHYETDFESARVRASEGNRLLAFLGAAVCGTSLIAVLALNRLGMLHGLYFALCLLMILAVMARQMFFGTYATMAGLQRMDYVAVVSIFFSFMLPITSLAYLMAARRFFGGNRELQIGAGAAGIATSATIAYLISLIVLRRTKLPPGVIYSWKVPMKHWRELLTFGWVTNVAIVGHTIIGLVPPIYVSYIMAHRYRWFGDSLKANMEQAGIFSAGFTYAMAPALIVGLTFALIPAMSEAEAQNNRPLLTRYFNVSIKYCFTLMAVITALYASGAGKLVSFVTGGNFPADVMHGITVYLQIALAVSSLFYLLLSMLIGLKRPAIVAKAVCVLLALEIAAMTVAAKITGDIHSAAFAIIIIMSGGVLFLLQYLVRKVGMRLEPAILVPPVVSGIVSWAAAAYGIPDSGHAFLAALVVVPGVFLIADGLLGGVEKEDLDILRMTLTSLRAGFAVKLIDALEAFFRLSPLFRKSGGNI